MRSGSQARVGIQTHNLLPISLDVTDHQTVEALSLFSLGNSFPLRKIPCSLGTPRPRTALAWTFGTGPVSNVAPGSGSQCRAGVCNCNHFLPQLALGLAPPLRTVGAGPRYSEGVWWGRKALLKQPSFRGNQLRFIKGQERVPSI